MSSGAMVVISFCLVRSSTCLCLVLSMLLVRWLRQSIQNLELEPAIAANQYYNCGASGGSSLGFNGATLFNLKSDKPGYLTFKLYQ